MPRGPAFRPFAARGRRAIAAIVLTFALVSLVTVALSIRATRRSQNRATVVEVAARQRTLAERYVAEVLLARSGDRADPAYLAQLLRKSANVLLNGGELPGVNGDDDETTLSRASGKLVRRQLEQGRRLVHDLTATGGALLAGRPTTAVRLTAKEHIGVSDPVLRLRVLAGLSSNVSLNAARTIATRADRNIGGLITLEVVLGLLGFAVSLAMAWALVAATRRQTAHFRSLVRASTDLVMVFGEGACRYVSQSVARMVGCPAEDLLGDRLASLLHPDDRATVTGACERDGQPPNELVFRMKNRFGEWRHLDAYVSDLRGDRHIRGVVLNARDVTERTRLEEELTRQAFHDGLTGLANRALFRDRVDQALARSLRSREVFTVLLIDLDGFKQVNDSLGHDAGDHLLEEVARRFNEAIRPGDTLARLGGDEFAVLLEGANEAAAVAIANRLLAKLSQPVQIAGHELVLGASIGVVTHPGGAGEREDLVRHADLAMYAAKEAGRNRYEVFHYDMARELGEQLGLEHELRLGLQRREVAAHYQPIVALGTAAIVGVEVLARWTSPSRGEVPPDRFVPVAESSGLIIQLGEFVLREACLQTASWLRAGLLPDPFVTWVNISGRQLTAEGLGDTVENALAAAGVPPSFLGLEVTETAMLLDGPAGNRARTELRRLHDFGVQIAIDDFGTGFSSLSQLRRFPIDVLKVDRSFVQGVEHNTKDAAIAANLVSLAHALGLKAVAEGIESDGQRTSLSEFGCDLAQGFLFERPLPGARMADVLAAAKPRSAAA